METAITQATGSMEARVKEKQASQQPAQEPNTPFAPIVCFACHKVGHKAAYCPEKKKNRMPGPASGSATKPVEASRTANRWRLTHLTAREARDASYAMTGEFSR